MLSAVRTLPSGENTVRYLERQGRDTLVNGQTGNVDCSPVI